MKRAKQGIIYTFSFYMKKGEAWQRVHRLIRAKHRIKYGRFDSLPTLAQLASGTYYQPTLEPAKD